MLDTSYLVSIYRGWDLYEKKATNNSSRIIDFDLLGEDIAPRSFTSREEILRELTSQESAIDDSTPEGKFARAKVLASCFYLRAASGEKIDFATYIRNTMGIPVKSFSETQLSGLRSGLEKYLATFGIGLDKKHEGEFRRRLLVDNALQVKEQVSASMDRWLPLLDELIGPFQLPEIDIQLVAVDAYWHNWVSGDSARVAFRINSHKRAFFIKGYPDVLAIHEICGHIVQASMWKKAILNKRATEISGILTIHSPEQFVSEGIAQTLVDILIKRGEIADPAITFSRDFERYRFMVYHNAHIEINAGIPADEIRARIGQLLPFEPQENISAELRDRSADPAFRTYQFVYAASAFYFASVIELLTPQQDVALIKKMYATALLPGQIQEWVEQEFDIHPDYLAA